MPYRTTPLINSHYYHVFNRGVEKRKIFLNNRDFSRFLKTLSFYQNENVKHRFSWRDRSGKNTENTTNITDIIAYCLMPNHFHLLLKQTKKEGITTLLRRSCNSYTKYFNTKHKRIGPLFQGVFKAKLIESDEQLIHTMRYIHLNPFVKKPRTRPLDYPYSSYNEYLGDDNLLCSKSFINDWFKTRESFKTFHEDHLDYAHELDESKHFDDDI